MSKIYVKYSGSDISQMLEICNLRHDCGRSCRDCVYNVKGHKVCRDMLLQFNKLSRAEQISVAVANRIKKED